MAKESSISLSMSVPAAVAEDNQPGFRQDVTARVNIGDPPNSAGPIKTTEANRVVPDARRAGRLRGPTVGWPESRAPRARGHSPRERGVRCR